MLSLYYPGRHTFPSLSCTGSWCGLSCLHCGGRTLHGMADCGNGMLEAVCEQAKIGGAAGALLSGGCTAAGAVPHDYVAMGRVARTGFLLNVHTGLLPDVPPALSRVACVSLDIPPSDHTVQEVYGLSTACQADYFDVLERLLGAGASVCPHVCIGIDGPEGSGEKETLERLASYVDRVVLLTLRRVGGQPYTDRRMNAKTTEKVIKDARERFKNLGLGCMRDRTPAKERLWHYFDTIAWPSAIMKDELARSERTCTTYETCCAV